MAKKEINNFLCPNWSPSAEGSSKARKLAQAVKRIQMLEPTNKKFRKLSKNAFVSHPWDKF